ncbi:hypothetical protein [Actinoplanes sp. TFC3]|uniref:hypothetical protein n=1 Tax=Actinoplanes sp. TFC3 TaxID=1710355 RepID=UPI0008373DE0|nr:hypothetical protein [Actinoplanes sp. TFC3]
MNDLRRHLEEIAGPAMAPTADQISDDLSRGRKALRRRRTLQAAGGGVLTAVAVAAGFVFTAGGSPATHGRSTEVAAAAPASAVAPSLAPETHLVPYSGKPGKGFSIDKIPTGWFVQTNDDSLLLLAPRHPLPGSTRLDSSAGPSTDPSSRPRPASSAEANSMGDPYSFVGKIGVALNSKDATEAPQGTKIKVGDHDGVLSLSKDTGDVASTISVEQPDGRYLQVQFWNGIGLTQEQMIEFTAAAHVLKDATQSAG